MNLIQLHGIIKTKDFSHMKSGKTFYSSFIDVTRSSGAVDTLKITYTEDFESEFSIGKELTIEGTLRSFSRPVANSGTKKSHLELYVFVSDVIDEEIEQNNLVDIDGIICKKPIIRQTPQKRDICDLFIVNSTRVGSFSYIPTIIWGKDAKSCETLNMGDRIHIKGRFQSRKYTKKYEDGTSEDKVAYELSVNEIIHDEPIEEIKVEG